MAEPSTHRQYSPGIRTTLWLIVICCVLPIACVAAFLIFSLYSSERNQLERGTADVTRVINSALDRDLSSTEAALRGLGTSPSLAEGKFEQAYLQAAQTLKYMHADSVALLDANGKVIFSTQYPYGRVEGQHANQSIPFPASDQAIISDLAFEPSTNSPSIYVSVPVATEGAPRFILRASVNASRFARLLLDQKLSGGWRCSIVDASGGIIATTFQSGKFVGTNAKPETVERLKKSAEGTFEAVTRDAVPVISTFTRSKMSGWSVVLSMPQSELSANLRMTARDLALWTLAALVLGLLLAFFVSLGLERAIDSIKASALALLAGGPIPRVSNYVREMREAAEAMEHVSRLMRSRTKELIESNKALRQREIDLKRAQEVANIGDWYWDAATEVFEPSLEVARIFGYEKSSTFADRVGTVFTPDSWQEVIDAFRASLHEGGVYDCELQGFQANGNFAWVHIRGEPERAESGHWIGIRGIMQDITVRKETEQMLEAERLAHRLDLEGQVAERTRNIARLNFDLEERTEEAEAANEIKGTFLATISHEIRTPLNAVVGLSGLLINSPLDQMQREYVKSIMSSAQVLRMLIDDVLDFSKIEAGALVLESASFSLNAIFKTVASIVSAGTVGKAIEVILDIADDTPDALVGDGHHLQQILLNLAGNAIKFTETGEIVISVHPVTRLDGAVELQFSVRDTGIGIPPDKLPHIFEAFVQADSSTSRRFGGTGLGLAICDRLVGLMGGEIHATSTLGVGSEFTFSVKVGIDAGRETERVDKELEGLHILIVDDHPLVRKVLSNACLSFHGVATAVESGSKALEELRRCTAEGDYYDYMLLDWHMPGMDGLETLKQAKSASDISLPLTLLMGSVFELDRTVYVDGFRGFDGVLTKPVTAQSLRESILRVHSGEIHELVSVPEDNSGRLQGMRLLVAEDNDINQQVIERILARAGADVTLVSNGFAAVEVLRGPDAHYDAVIMDVQMPVMDGYAATRLIRSELGLTELPIFALTAHASPEDREKSREAGMNGHVVKPIDVDLLFNMLRGKEPAMSQETAEQTEQADAPDNVPVLDVDAGLANFNGNMAKYAELLRAFIALHGSDAERALQLYLAGDKGASVRLVHELKGMGALLRAGRIARAATELEDMLRSPAAAHDEEVDFHCLLDEMHELMASIDRITEEPLA